jgi:hypothetical protein
MYWILARGFIFNLDRKFFFYRAHTCYNNITGTYYNNITSACYMQEKKYPYLKGGPLFTVANPYPPWSLA